MPPPLLDDRRPLGPLPLGLLVVPGIFQPPVGPSVFGILPSSRALVDVQSVPASVSPVQAIRQR